MGDVVLVVDHLDIIPRAPLPPAFTLRTYQPGDEKTWTRIHAETHAYDPMPAALFRREFGEDEGALQARQFFVVDPTGTEVATATAWFNDPTHGVPGGRIHWVAVVPSVQRQGIASALLAALAAHLKRLDETCAYLTTDAHNHRAIALYTRLGFRPAGSPR